MTGASIEATGALGIIAARGEGADAALVQPGASCGIGEQFFG